MERKKLFAIVLTAVVVGGTLMILIPSLLPQTEFRFSEGETRITVLYIRSMSDCAVDIRFINDPTLQMSYACSGDVSLEVTEGRRTSFEFSGGSENSSLSITLGNNTQYRFVIEESSTLDVSIVFNEHSHLLEDFQMWCSGSTLDLTIEEGATIDGNFFVRDLDSVDIDVTLPYGMWGYVQLGAQSVSILLNDGWERVYPDYYDYTKGDDSLPNMLDVLLSVDHIDAWLR